MNSVDSQMTVHGVVAAGFEPVRTTFQQLVDAGDLGEGGAAYAAYHRGALVVDLWAGAAGEVAWGRDTRNTWMSTTKAMTALCIQILVDRGRLDVDDAVAVHWPAFARNGKDAITIRHVLTHAGGVPGSRDLTALVDPLTGAGIGDGKAILEAIEDLTPIWEPGTRNGYHALTYSWILGEVLRRIDGRTLGTFFRDEVALPLGCDDAWIGTPDEEQNDIAPLLHLMTPSNTPEPAVAYMQTLLAQARDPDTAAGRSLMGRGDSSVLDHLPEVFNSPAGLRAELGGSNLVATARSIARIFAAIVEPDGIDGVRLASAESFEQFAELQSSAVDEVMLLPIGRALGYWRNLALAGRPQSCGPNEETILHSGMGGQLGFADPVARIAGAYTRSHHTAFPIAPVLLNNAVHACA